jgi:electron transport complex protein RnfB
MSAEIYGKLRNHYQQHPMGFPTTEGEVELRILQRLFSPEEAEMALELTPRAETAGRVAERIRKDPAETETLLERMADKGQILTLGKKGTRRYLRVPYIPGVWEFQLGRLDRAFAQDCEAYYAAQARDMFSSATSPARVVAVEKHIPAEMKIYPFEVASQIVREASKLALSDCICRKQQRLLGKTCEKPHENMCLNLSAGAEYFIEQGIGKEVSVDEALRALEKGEKAGLVLTAVFNVQKGPTGLCQCCACCCHCLRAAYELEIPNALAKSNFVPAIDSDLCIGCGSCVEICPMDALSLDSDEKATRNPDRCIGCGVCVSACPSGSLALERVPKERVAIPPETFTELMTEIAREKGRTTFYK